MDLRYKLHEKKSVDDYPLFTYPVPPPAVYYEKKM